MKKLRFLSFSSFVLTVIGALFSFKFQDMAYWGSNRTIGMIWYSIGAFLAYACSTTAVFLMFLKPKNVKVNIFDMALRFISSIIILFNVLWITFVFIAGLSGF